MKIFLPQQENQKYYATAVKDSFIVSLYAIINLNKIQADVKLDFLQFLKHFFNKQHSPSHRVNQAAFMRLEWSISLTTLCGFQPCAVRLHQRGNWAGLSLLRPFSSTSAAKQKTVKTHKRATECILQTSLPPGQTAKCSGRCCFVF